MRLDNEASEESKIGKFLYNHKLYVYICILIWVAFLSSSYYTLKVDSSTPKSLKKDDPKLKHNLQMIIQTANIYEWIIRITITISIFQGVILIIARVLAEPFYKFHLWREFYSWFGELHDYKSQVDGGDGD